MNETKELITFKQEQIDLIKKQIAPKATDNELKLFLYQAKRTGLDPLTRQIYAIHRACKENVNGTWTWVNKMSIQTSIDGFRVIAERSGDYGGQDEPIFEKEGDNLISCKVTVYRFRNNLRYPASVGVAHWAEYVQTDKEGNTIGLWKKMPHIMLAKVAEALALRKAYPQDLSGLYTSDEISDTSKEMENKEVIASGFFKEPEGAMKNLADGANEELKASKEEEKLNKLKISLSKMQSSQEIDDYLAKKFQGKTRLETLNSMSEVNRAQAMLIIDNAKKDLWLEQENGGIE